MSIPLHGLSCPGPLLSPALSLSHCSLPHSQRRLIIFHILHLPRTPQQKLYETRSYVCSVHCGGPHRPCHTVGARALRDKWAREHAARSDLWPASSSLYTHHLILVTTLWGRSFYSLHVTQERSSMKFQVTESAGWWRSLTSLCSAWWPPSLEGWRRNWAPDPNAQALRHHSLLRSPPPHIPPTLSEPLSLLILSPHLAHPSRPTSSMKLSQIPTAGPWASS